MRLFAGLDIGTTHTKILLLDESGQLIHQAKSSYTHGFGARLNPLELRDISFRLLDSVSKFVNPDDTLYCAFSAAMHSLLLVDKEGNPISELRTWADTESQPVVAQLRNDPAVLQLVEETGTPFHPMTPLAKMLWMRRQSPELLDSAFQCIGIKEFIWYHLTGSWETDCSMAAATGLYDPLLQDWHPLALQLTAVRKEQLPAIRPVHWEAEPNPVSETGNQPAELVQASSRIRFVLGGSDGCLAQIGSGAMKPRVASLTIGTSGAMRVVQPEFRRGAFNGLFAYQLDPGHYICGGPTNNGGIVLQWWEENVLGKNAGVQQMLEGLEQEISSVPPGADGLVCLPYFAGERAPVWNADASGIFAGVRLHHKQAHFKRAMVEGMCFIFRQLLERIEERYGALEEIILSGGFTQSGQWVQLLADILERPLMVEKEQADASALGAVAVALKAAGICKNWTDAERWLLRSYTICEPNPQHKSIYQNQYQQFLRLCLF
jgi:gluconokinase